RAAIWTTTDTNQIAPWQPSDAQSPSDPIAKSRAELEKLRRTTKCNQVYVPIQKQLKQLCKLPQMEPEPPSATPVFSRLFPGQAESRGERILRRWESLPTLRTELPGDLLADLLHPRASEDLSCTLLPFPKPRRHAKETHTASPNSKDFPFIACSCCSCCRQAPLIPKVDRPSMSSVLERLAHGGS
ncbi:unnamed protein product, partial [Polarella glacialis]